MAIGSTAVWEVRATGDDANGGFYTSGGTDYSQQDAAQLAVTDVVTNGTTAVSSATGGFTSAMIGNGINIAGTIYQVTGRTDTNTITVDAAIAAASGQAARVGGALASPGKACGLVTAGNKVYVRSGTYSITSASVNASGGCLKPSVAVQIIGYGSARDDGGAKPLLQASGIASAILVWMNAAKGYVSNIEVDGGGLTGITGFYSANSVLFVSCLARNCKATGFQSAAEAQCHNCEATGCSVQEAFSDIHCFRCVAHDNTAAGFRSVNGPVLIDCIAAANTGASSDGFICVTNFGAQLVVNCTAYGNGRHGFNVGSGIQTLPNSYENCLAVSNGGYGYGAGGADVNVYLESCAGFGNSSGLVDTANIPAGRFDVGLVTLIADPFVAAASGNYGLNNTAGGGRACRAAGVPGAYPGLPATVSCLDIGAVQHADSGGSATVAGRLSLSL